MSGAVWTASFVVLWGAVLVLLVTVLALLRQVGVLHARVDEALTAASVAAAAADGAGAGGAAAAEEGPGLGAAAPLAGRLGYAKAPMTVVAFVAEGCELSQMLLPALRRVDKQYGDAVRVVELTLGSRTIAAFEEFRVQATPFVVCVGRDGVVRATGRARSLPQLEELVASAGAAALAAARAAQAGASGAGASVDVAVDLTERDSAGASA